MTKFFLILIFTAGMESCGAKRAGAEGISKVWAPEPETIPKSLESLLYVCDCFTLFNTQQLLCTLYNMQQLQQHRSATNITDK